MDFKAYRMRKHLHAGSCPECGKLFMFRARWRVEDEYETHRVAYHPTFMDAMRSVTTALHRFSEVLT